MPTSPSDSKIHHAYVTLLSYLDLETVHAADLGRRGLTPGEIKSNQYKSLPLRRRELAAKVAEKLGGDLNGVPGFWRNEQGEWELAGKTGLVIPVWNWERKIEALKLRVDKPLDVNQKYILLSSRPQSKGQLKYPEGTAAHIAVHFPLDRPRERLKVLRITEGELKADVTTSLSGVYTISIPGVTMWRMALDVIRELKPGKVLLAFDSDKNKRANSEGSTDASYVTKGKAAPEREAYANSIGQDDYAVGKTLANLYTAIREMDPDLVIGIEDWPEDAGKGIDDVLINGATDQIRELTQGEVDAFLKDMLGGETPEGWVYIIGTKRFLELTTNLELDKEQFGDRFAHEEKGNPADKALRNPAFPKLDLPIYRPVASRVFREGGHRYLNLWLPNELKESRGAVGPFLKHMEYLFPEKKETALMLDWLAYNVQHPGHKIHWALLIQGVQGTGKSYLGYVMRKVLGDRNVSLPTNEMLHEPYTAWQKCCQLVIIEELMARGRLELMNKLKPMITQEVTMVREMFKPSYVQPNVFNLLLFTNHEDSIIIDETDRRYCVLYSKAKPREAGYYRDLWAWTDENAGRVLRWFKERELKRFIPKGHAPITEGKRELVRMSMNPLQAWIKEGIELENWPFMGDLVSVNHLLDCLPRHLGNLSMQGLGRALKSCGACQLPQVKLSTGASVRPWTLRRHEIWAHAERETIAREYEKWGAGATPGGEDQYNPLLQAKPL